MISVSRLGGRSRRSGCIEVFIQTTLRRIKAGGGGEGITFVSIIMRMFVIVGGFKKKKSRGIVDAGPSPLPPTKKLETNAPFQSQRPAAETRLGAA